MTFAGLSQSVTFYKGAMDRLGVGVDLVRIAEFKGAMEPYVMTSQSAPVRENRDQLLDDVYARILAGHSLRARLPQVSGRSPCRRGAGPRTWLGWPSWSTSARSPPRRRVRVGSGRRGGRPERDRAATSASCWGDGTWTSAISMSLPVTRGAGRAARVAVVMVDGAITDGPSQRLPFDAGRGGWWRHPGQAPGGMPPQSRYPGAWCCG